MIIKMYYLLEENYLELIENRISTLDLSNVVEDRLELYDALKVNTSLTSLNLSCNYLDDIFILFLSEILYKNKLVTLDLSRNIITNSGCKTIAAALLSNTSLETLNLAYNEIEDRGAAYLSVALRTNKTLKMLDLSHNFIETDMFEDTRKDITIDASE